MVGPGWEPALATIVAVRFATTGAGPSGSRAEFVADVQPEGGEPAFRATFKGPPDSTGFREPRVGQAIRVRYDPASKQVEIDPSDTAELGRRATDAADPDRR